MAAMPSSIAPRTPNNHFVTCSFSIFERLCAEALAQAGVPPALLAAAVERERLLREDLAWARAFAQRAAWQDITAGVCRGVADPQDPARTWLDIGTWQPSPGKDREHMSRAVALLESLGAIEHHSEDPKLVRAPIGVAVR
jgi:hypothetical protein